jgi:hypothetical protein
VETDDGTLPKKVKKTKKQQEAQDGNAIAIDLGLAEENTQKIYIDAHNRPRERFFAGSPSISEDCLKGPFLLAKDDIKRKCKLFT